ncbi:hypothetical protein NSK_007496 [Nannochloropsis salina CCMP1776]|uniref:Uncharacterized protein n=1 Tax=Nannochloropsis salina CCMP1776 TaxID=1027361 RepID=A0A4D9CPU8_9STRA|nr:hypothetical protein NSK_007496 [Nannochloropsis salina CCMP1776]|eukprot:TFJ81150.1 hypothetical protein NSK_007496 [Nannochloropsis salina CCMP1776]
MLNLIIKSALLFSVLCSVEGRRRGRGPRRWMEEPNNQTVPTDPPFPAGVSVNDIVYLNFVTKPKVHRAGRTVVMRTKFRFESWPEGATSMYCAMRNYNTTSDLTTFAVINQDISHETSGPLFPPSSFGIEQSVQSDRVEWVFDQSGKDLVVGRTWNLLGRLRLNRHATANQYVWRAYCETKQPPGRNSWYYFKSWMEVTMRPARGK